MNLDLGFSWSATSPESLDGVQSRYGESHGPVYLKWKTDTGLDWVDHFDISVSYRYVPKGMVGIGDGGYGVWSKTYWSGVEASECTMTKLAGQSGYQWAYPLGSLGEYVGSDTTPSGTTIGRLTAPSGWDYDDRLYDCIAYHVSLRTYYPPGKTDQYGNNYSRIEDMSIWVGYFPDYTLTGVTINSDGVDVTYSAPGWTRTDDRWQLVSLSSGGTELARQESVPGTTWDTVADAGLIHIPLDALTGLPETGRIHVSIRMNASYRDVGMDFAWLEGMADYVNPGDCNTPTLSLVGADADAVRVAVGDSGDLGAPIDTVHVYIVGSTSSSQVVTGAPGTTVSIPLPPLGASFVVQAYGTTDTATSEVASLTVPAITSGAQGITIAAADGSLTVKALLNPEVSWSFEPVSSSKKFSGRERESVAYGVGGSVTGTIKCSVLDGTQYGALAQLASDFERLAFAGPCIYRDDTGKRMNVTVDSVGESYSFESRAKSMSVSIREVS